MTRTPQYKKQKYPKSGASWHMDRRKKYRSKTTSDSTHRPKPKTRSKYWVSAYTRKTKTGKAIHVKAHYRKSGY